MAVKVTPVTPLECSVKVMKQKPLRVFHTLTCVGSEEPVGPGLGSLSHTHMHAQIPCGHRLPLTSSHEGGLGDCRGPCVTLGSVASQMVVGSTKDPSAK